MRTGFKIALVALSAAFVAAAQPAAAREYVEVLGRIENLSYQSTNDPDDLLGHGWMTARLHVVKVVGAKRLPRVVLIRYFGHTYYVEGRKMRFKLMRGDDGVYIVCAQRGASGLRCP